MNELDLSKYELNLSKLDEALRRQEVGAVEFAILLKCIDKGKAFFESTLELLAYMHRMKVHEYVVMQINYLKKRGIITKSGC